MNVERVHAPTPSTIARSMQPSAIRQIVERARSIPDVIHLEIGEPGTPPPAHVRKALIAAVEAGVSGYTATAGIPPLREAIATKVRSCNSIDADAQNVVVTPGGVAGLYVAALALCDPGQEILVPDPGWPNYRIIARAQHLSVASYPMAPDGAPRAELIEPLIGPLTRAIIVNSPANPTGAVVGAGHLAEIAALARERDLWIISDEVYDEVTFEEAATSTASVADPERVVTVFSFSKTYAMTGWRLGYVVGPKEIVTSIAHIHQATATCASAPVQHAGVAALEGPAEYIDSVRRTFRERRDRVLAILDGAKIPAIPPAGGLFVWVDVSASGLDAETFAFRLLDSGVAVAPGTAFGDAGHNHVRFALGAPLEQLEVGASRLAELVHGSGSK